MENAAASRPLLLWFLSELSAMVMDGRDEVWEEVIIVLGGMLDNAWKPRVTRLSVSLPTTWRPEIGNASCSHGEYGPWSSQYEAREGR